MKELLSIGEKILVNSDVHLSPLSMDLAEDLYRLSDRNRDHLSKWLPWVKNTRSVEDTRAFIGTTGYDSIYERTFAFGIFSKGKLVGIADFTGSPSNKTLEIGYWLSEDITGQGIMTNVCKSMIHFAFENSDANRIVIKCATGNFKSQQIPNRLGFLREGVEREGLLIDGKFHDLNINSLLRSDWEGSPACQEFIKGFELAVAS